MFIYHIVFVQVFVCVWAEFRVLYIRDILLCLHVCNNLLIDRLSSIDTKYQIWKMGVVLTDNVSLLNVYTNIIVLIITLPMSIFFASLQQRSVIKRYLCINATAEEHNMNNKDIKYMKIKNVIILIVS